MTDAQRKRFAEALDRLAGDEETLLMLAGIVVEDSPSMMTQLSEWASQGDMEGYARTAHALKGLLSTFETGEPVSELQSAIDSAREGNAAVVQKTHGELVPEIERLIEEIDSIAHAI